MIVGHKPNGYTSTATGEGKKVEGETRQCVHCQYTWQYQPGSGARRGFCLHCYGLICGREECFRQQALVHQTYPDYNCMPYNDFINRELERFARESGYELTPSGILIPRGMRMSDLRPDPVTPSPHEPHTSAGWNI